MNFWEIARTLLPKSNCLKRHYACVIVKDGRVIASGYNTSLKTCSTCARLDIEHNTGSYDGCGSVHAEVAALLGIDLEKLRGAELYLVCNEDDNPKPCPTCQKLIDYCGVKIKSRG